MPDTLTISPPSPRPDIERLRAARHESRSAERLAAHYVVETQLARRLATADRRERATLYSELYRDLFAAVPDHPQNRASSGLRGDRIRGQVAFLRRWLLPAATYVEIGCGDAALTKALAPHTARTIGIDVTGVLVDATDAPENFAFVPTDGTALDLPDAGADLVYSNQLMEHLHVDDAAVQLREVLRILKPGGRYVCATPNRLTGPHDISCYFGYEASGFHMREYDHRSLAALFRGVGFSGVACVLAAKGRVATLPVAAVAPLEWALDRLPRALRARLATLGPVVSLAGLTLVGTK